MRMKLTALVAAAAMSLSAASSTLAAGGAFANLFAVVTANGATVNSSGLQTVRRLTKGAYELTFNRDIVNCAVSITLNNVSGYAYYKAEPTDDAAIRVVTLDKDGSPTWRAFSIIIVCG